MDDNITIMTISLLVLIFFSAFFSATETAYSSLNRIRLKNMAELNDKAKSIIDRYMGRQSFGTQNIGKNTGFLDISADEEMPF